MKALVLGAGGMAGHVVSLHLREKGHDIDTLSANHPLDAKTTLLDVTNTARLKQFLDAHDYEAVINCIALLVKPSEEHKDLAVLLNAHLPHFLEAYYKDTKTKVVHLSSDGVFSNEHSPYKEDALYDGQGFYDRSKALGELRNDKDITFRMSIIGPDTKPGGTGLVNWLLQQKGEISGFDKVFWTGVTTLELAKGIEAAIKQDLTGIYHFVPPTNISKFNLLKLMNDIFERGITIKPKGDVKFDRTLLNTRTDFDFTIPDYKSMIQDMKQWITSHSRLYHHYQ